jgi:hypothetical protein
MLRQINPVHDFPTESFKIKFNIILPSNCIPNGLYPSGFSLRTVYESLLFP